LLIFFLLAPLVLQNLEATDLRLAPPPREVSGLLAAPIDIQRLRANLVFDCEAKTASVESALEFLSSDSGFPVFDLRQSLIKATLNQKPWPLEKLRLHDFGRQTGELRILESLLPSGILHQLDLEYALRKPKAPQAKDILWEEGALEFDFWFTDLLPGRYLGQWFSSNLIFDAHPFDLEIQILHAKTPHRLVTNASVTKLGDHHWKLSFPADFTAFSPMVVILPESKVKVESRTIRAGKNKIEVEVVRRNEVPTSTKNLLDRAEKAVKDFSKSMGPWPHGSQCKIFIWTGGRSMEYDGATTSSVGALRHELFHSWYGRGVKPASQNDAWWDEAFDVYFSDGMRLSAKQAEIPGQAVALFSDDPWNRITHPASYMLGSHVFGRLSFVFSAKKLHSWMAEFFQINQRKVVTTKDLENFLARKGKSDEVHAIFSRYVYGKK